MRMSPAIIVNGASVLAFVGIGAFCVKEAYLPLSSRASGTSEHRESQLVVGKQLPLVAKYEWHSHKKTLLLALRNGCHYCEDSAPFYRTLAGLESSGAIKNVHILVTSPSFCTSCSERVYITASGCEIGFGGAQGLQAAGAGGL